MRYNFGNTPGAGDANSTYVAGTFYYDTSLPAVRQATNGVYVLFVTGLDIVMNGRGASRSVAAGILEPSGGFRSAGGVTIDAASRATDAWSVPVYRGFASRDPSELRARIQVDSNGLFYIGRNTAGPGSVVGTGGLVRPGSMAGGLEYIQSPGAPSAPTVRPNADGRSALLSFTGATDGGGAPILGHRVQFATDSAFTKNVRVQDVRGTTSIDGLTPGQRYYWRLAARNEVTDWVDAVGGLWSPTVTTVQPTPVVGGKVFDGTRWVAGKLKVFDGSRWVDGRIRVFDGARWVDAK